MRKLTITLRKLSFFIIPLGFIAGIYAEEWKPPKHIIGKWETTAEVFAEWKKGEYPSKEAEDWFELKLHIHEDGKVTGTFGEAKLVNCKVESNRGWLGKKLNIKSDYIIKGGTLEGKICQRDDKTSRMFTIPFNIFEGQLKGGFMELEKWKYPYPTFPRLKFDKIMEK